MSQATCERCGAPLPADARFCPNCGFPVGISRAEERKVVTVLFADLTSSTQLAAHLDPERFREVLAAFYGVITDELASLRGRAENYIGDAVLGVFGVPHAHDDDAVRAIRAGLAIIDRTGRLQETLGLADPLRVRVGVNTGPVAVGAGPADQPLVLGAEVNLAARLQQAAEPGEILVGETTHLLAERAVSFGPGRRIKAKGFDEEVPAWPVVGLAPGSTRRTIPLVDRRPELALLSDTFGRAVERGRAHLVTLVGEPGIGKSRLADEFLDRLPEGTKVLTGRASPFAEDVAFGPIAEMVLRELGEDRDAPAERLRERLHEVVEGCCEPSDVEQVAARLGLALGIGLEEEAGDGHRRFRGAEVRAGMLTFLSALVSTAPAVVVFEDLHQGGPELLELIEELVKEARRIPLMVLCVARWELIDEVRPNWAGGIPDAVTLWLEPLADDDAVQLAVEAGEGLDAAEAARIARHAGGNPFFIVETTGMLLHRTDDAAPVGALTGHPLPPTVQAVVAARLDHLSEAGRDLIRKAAVFARPTFDLSDLSLLTEPGEDVLAELEDEEILVRDPDREGVWRFRHGLLRDVAYEGLAKRERQRLHLRVANKMSEPETAGRYPRAIAYHLEQAARAALDLNPRDRTLAERAVEALARAGDQARRGIESRAAEDLYMRALAMAGPEHGWGDREAWILSALGEARYWMGEFERAARALKRALEVGGSNTLVRAHASRFLADISLTIHAEPDRAAGLFEQSLKASRELGDPFVLARTLLMAGWVPYWRNELDAARAMFEEALAVARANPRKDAWAEARALVGLASVTSPVGDERDCLILAEEALAIGRASGDAFTTAVAEEKVSASLRRMMRLDEAFEHVEISTRTFRELGARWELASTLGDRGRIHRLTGRLDEAEADLREAYLLCREIKERALVTWTASELARILVAKGEPADARRLLDEPEARLAAREPGSATDLLTAEAVLALAEGDEEGALAKALAALELERGQGWPNFVAAQLWWAGRLFGSDAVGGETELDRARETLRAAHWEEALAAPELVRG